MKDFHLIYLLLCINCWCWFVVGFDCDFEIPCDWKLQASDNLAIFTKDNLPASSKGLHADADSNPNATMNTSTFYGSNTSKFSRIKVKLPPDEDLSSTDDDCDPNVDRATAEDSDETASEGHFLYYHFDKHSNRNVSLNSPVFPEGTLSECSLEFSIHMQSMENGKIQILINTEFPVEIDTIPGNNQTRWKRYSQHIGRKTQSFSLLIEIISPSKPEIGHVAIDNIRVVKCLKKPLETSECNSRYFLCPENVCIYKNQVCDISVDCQNGEDEQQQCDEIPRAAYCDFEKDTCEWTSNDVYENNALQKWVRESGRDFTAQRRPFEPLTYRNETGHYMVAQFSPKSSFGAKSILSSPTFRPPPICHRTVHSSYYNTCQVRFFAIVKGKMSGSLELNCVVLDPSYKEKAIPMWTERGNLNNWMRVVLPLPAIRHRYFLQFVAIRSLAKIPNFAIDNISLSPECFGIGVNESEKIPEEPSPMGYHFTSCGKKGTRGPNNKMCSFSYSHTNTIVQILDVSSEMAGIQKWTVPQTNTYTVVARGGGGGRGMRNNNTSRGAIVRGSFQWTQGDVIYILVGQEGIGPCNSDKPKCPEIGTSRTSIFKRQNISEDIGGGGGGASYIFKLDMRNNQIPLLIAGGGGGSSSDKRESGGVDPNGQGYNSSLLAGNGVSSPRGAGGGGGWKDITTGQSAGRSLSEGGNGGTRCSSVSPSPAEGGFGGGGGPCTSGGGGGGYKGGDAPISDNAYTSGQGGTSYIRPKTMYPFVEPGLNEGDGAVDILPAQPGCGCEYLCLMLDIENEAFHCLCPPEEELTSDRKHCISKTVLPPKPKDSFYHHIILIVLSICVTIILIATFVYIGVNRYNKKKKPRDLSHEPLNNTEVQLNRLRQVGGGMVTEYNPNYEFGGTACTIQDLPQIPREQLTLVKALGQGAFGEVYQGYLSDGRFDENEIPVAVKTLPDLSSSQSEMDFLMEALIMSKFNHPNIVKFIGVCFEKLPRFIILELLPGGDLKTFLRKSRPKPHQPSPLSMKDLLNLSLDVAKGCQYLEKNYFIHRDIAARNCLLTTKNPGRMAKIADFGMARDIYRADYYRKGGKAMLPVKWMPPEAFLDGIFTTKTDVWSFGVLLWEVMSLGYMPYPGWGNEEVMKLVTSGGRLEPPNNCPNQVYHIMMRCWHPIPDERPTFSTIIERLGYCLQDPDVINASLPVFHRPPSMEKDATIMKTPDSENSCLQVQRSDIVSPGSEDYLIPMPSSNYSLATDNTEVQSSPSLGSVDQLLELDETTTKPRKDGGDQSSTRETNLSHPPFDKKGYQAIPIKDSREHLSNSDSLEALPVAPNVEHQTKLPLNVEALQRQTANHPIRYINVDVNGVDSQSNPAYDGVDGVNPVA